ncbi:hypothetical protein EV13_1672 [Prochlorococcus sp. MIT 0702]|nr:hypothetical protein EV12_1561 [Prochlorococcus sp. MIT 0701]KGG28259.1 hypothetical protein EV13_1672 [Prochlorococcus sp. MIT 0702]KGG31476.1 hypothetical protein EV14_2268 [Prochlorococcus sp. MIT 0703]
MKPCLWRGFFLPLHLELLARRTMAPRLFAEGVRELSG